VGAYAQDAAPKLNYNSEGGYYEIANEEDMIAFITFCRSSKSPTCTGMTFKVTASELDMGGDRFKHITGGFAGTFDGQGVVIKNREMPSLFETIQGGTVMNITIDSSCKLGEYWHMNNVGGIATHNVGGKNDSDDVYEMTAGGVKHYNGAVLEGSTAITGISKDQEDADIYTLDGRRVGSVQRGVNIIRANGSVRKVSVK